jgi:pyridinium-3,5-bisthiocarboxylic acid mononucleotide nickel chelatase
VARIVYFDCFSGASGDMVLGALLDLGLPLDGLRAALGSLAIECGELAAERVLRAGVSATKFRLGPLADAGSAKAGEHHHHHHHLKQIVTAIGKSALSERGKARAVALFQRLAEAEAAIHDVPVEKVHLHEVGAVDSIVDIVGAVYGMEWLAADRIVASPLNVGGGTVECAHGTFPVPAPATMRLLANVPVYAGEPATELVTPTGALLVTGYATSFAALPPMRVRSIGYGAGDKDFRKHPNVLRVIVGEDDGAVVAERIVVLECEIDDMNPQLFGPLMDRLQQAGALDVFYAAVQMKKNRPGTLVTVIARPDDREALSSLLFAETTTIGVRYREMLRDRLEREQRTIETPLGPVRFKVASRDGRVLNAAPEFDDCAKLAAARGVPIKDVQALAMKAWLDSAGAQAK